MNRVDSDAVFQSYGRCCKHAEFFEHFYNVFRGTSGEVRQMFTQTDMTEQRRLLRAGISWLIMYARGGGRAKLETLASSHSRDGYNVASHLYHHWVESLLETVRTFDHQCDPALESQWRAVLHPGIEIIAGGYER